MAHHPGLTIDVRRYTLNGCEITLIVADPADQQQLWYGTVTLDGALVGSFYPADRIHQRDWHIVTPDRHLHVESDSAALYLLTTELAGQNPSSDMR